MKNKTFLWFIAVVLMIAGCAKPYGGDSASASGDSANDIYGAGGTVYGADGYTIPGTTTVYGNVQSNTRASLGDFYDDPAYGVNVVGGPQASAKDRVIYFSYDSAQLDSRSIAVVHEHARYLRDNPQTRVVLEGHTDERGSRDYNVGLGERRAYSVRNVFIEQGVNPAQLRVLSYGEERPAAFCSNEECYAKNRRAVIIY